MPPQTIPRYLEKFVHSTGAPALVFPTLEYEWQTSGGLLAVRSTGSMQSYATDHLHSAIAPRTLASEETRFIAGEDTAALTDTQIDLVKSTCLRIGRGKLWTLGADGTRRWAWARLRDMPDLRLSREHQITRPVVIAFDRFSDWFAEALTSVVEVVTATGQQWTVANPGNIPATLMTIRLRANTAGGIVDPNVQNLTNGFILSSLRDSQSSNSEIRLNTEIPSIEYSNDDGGSYVGDFANYVMPAAQGALTMRLEPGNNTVRYTGGGAPSLNVQIEFYAPFA